MLLTRRRCDGAPLRRKHIVLFLEEHILASCVANNLNNCHLLIEVQFWFFSQQIFYCPNIVVTKVIYSIFYQCCFVSTQNKFCEIVEFIDKSHPFFNDFLVVVLESFVNRMDSIVFKFSILHYNVILGMLQS